MDEIVYALIYKKYSLKCSENTNFKSFIAYSIYMYS